MASNEEIADVLDRIADLLEIQEANFHRIRAYRKGAQSIRSCQEPVSELVLEKGTDALQEIPFIGKGMASTISEFVRSGRSRVLDRLRGEVSPEDLFSQVPGIGEGLAHRITQELDIETLEELEQAAHNSRLRKIEGFGQKRIQAVRNNLAGILSGAAQRRTQRAHWEKEEKGKPEVGILLDVDAEYRRRAQAGRLKKIAPRRFNPQGKAWLPIMHGEREGWSFTALYSNTARAHQLGTVMDWVVIYYQRDGRENQCTVVTEKQGALKGKRVVRGREAECKRYYKAMD